MATRPPWVKVADFADEVTDFAIATTTLYLMSHKGAPALQGAADVAGRKPDFAGPKR